MGPPQKKNLWTGVKISIGNRQGKVCEEPAPRRCWEKVRRSHKFPNSQLAALGGQACRSPALEVQELQLPPFALLRGAETWSGAWGAERYNCRQSDLPAPCPKHRDRVLWCARPPLAENQPFVPTTPFSFPFLSEVFSWRRGRRRARGGAACEDEAAHAKKAAE